MKALAPYLDEFWRDSVEERGIGGLDSISYPPNAPLSVRADWRGKVGAGGTNVVEMQRRCSINSAPASPSSIASTASSSVSMRTWRAPSPARSTIGSSGMARPRSAAARLDRLPMQNAEFAVDEIERLAATAASSRFWCWRCGDAARPAVLLADLCRLRTPRPADRHPCRQQSIAIRHLARLAELLHRGLRRQRRASVAGDQPDHGGRVCQVPGLKVVLIESGVTWLPGSCGDSPSLARFARRDTLGRPPTRRDRPRPFPPDRSSGRETTGLSSV